MHRRSPGHLSRSDDHRPARGGTTEGCKGLPSAPPCRLPRALPLPKKGKGLRNSRSSPAFRNASSSRSRSSWRPKVPPEKAAWSPTPATIKPSALGSAKGNLIGPFRPSFFSCSLSLKPCTGSASASTEPTEDVRCEAPPSPQHASRPVAHALTRWGTVDLPGAASFQGRRVSSEGNWKERGQKQSPGQTPTLPSRSRVEELPHQ